MLDLEPIKDRLDAISESLDPEMPGIARARRVADDISALIEEVEYLAELLAKSEAEETRLKSIIQNARYALGST